MKRIMKKVLSIMLVMAMVCAPMTALAEEGTPEIVASGSNVALEQFQVADIANYCNEEHGILTVTITDADPGWFVGIQDWNTWDSVSGNSYESTGNSVSYEMFEGSEAAITIMAFNPELDEYGDPKGYCAGTLSYEVTFTPCDPPEEGEHHSTAIALDSASKSVTIGAGKTVWYSYASPSDLTEFTLKVTSNTAGYTVYDKVTDTTMTDSTGVAELDAFADYSSMKVVFSITNNSDTENQYNIVLKEKVGTYNNPEVFDGAGEYTATLKGGYESYYYVWKATQAGTVTVTMLDDEWYYGVNYVSHYSDGDYNYSTSSYDDPVPTESVDVAVGDEVRIFVNTYDEETSLNPEGTVRFKVEFTAGEVTPPADDDDEPVEKEYVDYKNQVTPEKFELVLGDTDTIVELNVIDSEKEVAVLGKDGFYHLNSEDGPVLLVNLGSNAPYISLKDLQAYGQNKAVLYNDDDTVKEKIDFYNAVDAYVKCLDSTGYYPLTEDLVYMYKALGESKGWYDMEDEYGSYIFYKELPDGSFAEVPVNEENAWLFACAYVDAPAAKVTEGKDSKWTKETTADVTIRVDADFDTFASLRIDGKDVPADKYTVKEGSIVVTLKAAYLETLAVGEHTVTVVHNNATVTNTTLTIAAAPVDPADTADSSNIALWIAVLGLGVVAIAGSVVMKKREF